MLLLQISLFSCVRLCATLRTAACQAPLSVGFSRQEYWSGLPFPPTSGDLPNPGIGPRCPAFQTDSLLLTHQGSPYIYIHTYFLFKISFLFKSPQQCIEFPMPYSRFSPVIYFTHMKRVFKLQILFHFQWLVYSNYASFWFSFDGLLQLGCSFCWYVTFHMLI